MHPVLFKIGSFPVHTFGVLMVFAFLGAIAVLRARAERYGMTKTQVGDLATWTLIAGVLGARALFIAQDWSHFSTHPKELYTLQFQGLTSFGGLIAGAATVMIWAWRNKIPLGSVLDLAAPAFVLGSAIGRVGCLFNGCCYGRVCYPGAWYGVHVEGSDALHVPAQIFDTVMNLAALGLLLWVERRRVAPLVITGGALFLHGLARFIYEFWRAGTVAEVNAGVASSTRIAGMFITEAQVMALAISLLGVGVIAFALRRKSGSVRAATA